MKVLTEHISGLILFFALILPLVTLAELTSFLVLSVFALVNPVLITIKQRSPEPIGVMIYLAWIANMGFATIAVFLAIELISNLL